jgi:hypothetical protein
LASAVIVGSSPGRSRSSHRRLAGKLGRFASSFAGAHVSDFLLPKIDEPGQWTRNDERTVRLKIATPADGRAHYERHMIASGLPRGLGMFDASDVAPPDRRRQGAPFERHPADIGRQ